MKSKNHEEIDSDEEEIDEFDRGTGNVGHERDPKEEDEEDEDYPDSDESESDEEEEEGDGEDREGIEEDEEEEFEIDIDDSLLEEERAENGVAKHNKGNGADSVLLLLPSPPRNPAPEKLKAIYTPPLTAAFQHLSPTEPSILTIAIHVPFLSGGDPRGKTFARTQRLLARLYSLSEYVAVKEERELLVDTRIIFLSDIGQDSLENDSSFGPVLSLRKLAECGREWGNIIIATSSTEEEKEESEGEIIAKTFLGLQSNMARPDTVVFRCDLGAAEEEVEVAEVEENESGAEHSIVAGMNYLSIGRLPYYLLT